MPRKTRITLFLTFSLKKKMMFKNKILVDFIQYPTIHNPRSEDIRGHTNDEQKNKILTRIIY